jgi:hypothetical protein
MERIGLSYVRSFPAGICPHRTTELYPDYVEALGKPAA